MGKVYEYTRQLSLAVFLASLFTLLALSTNVSAQNAPDYLFGNFTFERNLTKEQSQELADKVTNYTNTMLKAANGNETKLSVLLFEDMAKRNIIDAEAKAGFLSYIAKLPKPPMVLPGTIPGNLTIPGNVTLTFNSADFLKDLDASSAVLDEIARNNSDSQIVSQMTDILKKKVTDIGTLVSGNGTDIVTFSEQWEYPDDLIKGAACAAAFTVGGGWHVGAAQLCGQLLWG